MQVFVLGEWPNNKLRLKNYRQWPVKFYLSKATNSSPIEVPANTEVIVDLADFADTATLMR
jgi:hypothetical protein